MQRTAWQKGGTRKRVDDEDIDKYPLDSQGGTLQDSDSDGIEWDQLPALALPQTTPTMEELPHDVWVNVVANLSVKDLVSISLASKSIKHDVALAVHAHLHDLRMAITASNVLVLYSPSSVESEDVDTFTFRPTGSSSNIPGLFSTVVITATTRAVYGFVKFAGVDHLLPTLFTTVDVPVEDWDNYNVKIMECNLDFEVVTRPADTPQEHSFLVYWYFARRSANTFSIDKIVIHCKLFKLLEALARLRGSQETVLEAIIKE